MRFVPDSYYGREDGHSRDNPHAAAGLDQRCILLVDWSIDARNELSFLLGCIENADLGYAVSAQCVAARGKVAGSLKTLRWSSMRAI